MSRMSHVSHKLSNSLEGALAGGGDPATSPLYVFGPFLHLIVLAGVAQVTFGASVWLAVFTVLAVSVMYRLVMTWVTDGSGGSGLNEDEFGSWAVKVNASITFVEYTLTFLVSMAALVTFVADRLPMLNQQVIGIQGRTLVAVALSVLTGVLVNRGPRLAARVFGPATAGVLILLWAMIVATVWQRGFHLPSLQLRAFVPPYIHFTFAGYARILALMTGIEIFANLVAAYDGPPRERSRKAFGSLLLIMGTTSLTMLVVGPAILALADPLHPEVSVFTQTMDRLLPGPLAYLGTLVGTAVLLSAAAASAQGLQNLALGLRYRHYLPAYFGQRNAWDVADKPVWIEVGIVVLCFLVFGTREETYLSLYAAGVFVLLSLTGWAAVKRLARESKAGFTASRSAALLGTAAAALLTSGATLIIFVERFREGVWIYLLLVPVLYVGASHVRRQLGDPTRVEDRLGRVLAETRSLTAFQRPQPDAELFRRILVPLDGSGFAEHALPISQHLARAFGAQLRLLSVVPETDESDPARRADLDPAEYLARVTEELGLAGLSAHSALRRGEIAEQIFAAALEDQAGLIVLCTHGRSKPRRWLTGSLTTQMVHYVAPPLLVLRPDERWRSTRSRFQRLLVPLDGSDVAEQALPYARAMARRFGSEIVLLSVPEGSESESFSATIESYLDRVVEGLQQDGLGVRRLVTGSGPARTIVSVCEAESADLVMMVTHGRGGTDRMDRVKVGSVTERVIESSPCPVFVVSAEQPETGPGPAAA
jgi:nucleotide-binding universal stress UspA family protein